MVDPELARSSALAEDKFAAQMRACRGEDWAMTSVRAESRAELTPPAAE
jgi:hypothetical protein